jgi:hypothetical protein
MHPSLIVIGLFCIRFYTIVELKLQRWWDYLVANHECVRRFRQSVIMMRFRMRQATRNYKVEPPYPYWSISCANDTFNELVVPSNDNFAKLVSMVEQTSYRERNDYLLISSDDCVMQSRIFESSRANYAILMEKVRNPFLSIEYSHPDMEHRIVLELDPRFLTLNNEILSNTFVRRCLAYQSDEYVFDRRYVLHIMDSKIRTFTMEFDEHVVLCRTPPLYLKVCRRELS